MNLFDVIGPIMIGPSSSHTAGAVSMALVARKMFPEPICKVSFTLYILPFLCNVKYALHLLSNKKCVSYTSNHTDKRDTLIIFLSYKVSERSLIFFLKLIILWSYA